MRYEFVEGNSSKFWEVELQGNTLNLKWGRIGTDGQAQQKTFASPDKARAEHDKLVAEKLKKGYHEAGGAPKKPAKPTSAKPAKVTGSITPLFLQVSHHQFTLEDSENTGQSFTFDSIDDGLETQPHGVVVHFRRAAGAIPLVVEVRADAPAADFEGFHLVAEGSFEAPSGALEVGSPEATWSGRITVPPGWLRVQVRQADTDTCTDDASDGADHYRVILWPAPEAKTRVVHSRDVKDDTVFEPKAKLPQLEKDLSAADHKDQAVRELATSLLEKLGAPLEDLIKLAKSGTTQQRESTATSLGKSRAPGAFEPLVALLHKDKEVGVQRLAAEGLGRLGDRRAIPHLAKHLENGDYNFNWYVAEALSKLGGPEATKLLWKYASMPDSDERFECLGREATDRLADMLGARARVKAGETLSEGSPSPDLDDSVVKVALLAGSKDDRLCERGLRLLRNTTEVELVAAALSRSGEEVVEQAIRTLDDMLSDQVVSEALRQRAAKAVAPHAEAMSKLPGQQGRHDLRVQWLKVLSSIGGPFAYDAALTATHSPEADVRAQAARSLGVLGPDRALEALAALLGDKQSNVRHAAAEMLGLCEKEKVGATKALTAFLKVAKGSAKSVAQSSLQQLS